MSMLSHVSILLCVMAAAGCVDAYFMLFMDFSGFYCNALHGALLALFVMENMALLSDLNAREPPDPALLRTQQLQMEVIKQLNLDRCVLERKLAMATQALGKKNSLSRIGSWRST